MAIARTLDSAIFASIFPPKDYSTPTPQATPELGSIASPGQSFGGFRNTTNAVDIALQTNRAWSIVTAALKQSFDHAVRPNRDFTSAFELLASRDDSKRSLYDWYMNEVTLRFRASRSHYEKLCKVWSVCRRYQLASEPPVGDLATENLHIMETLLLEVNKCMLKSYLSSQEWSSASAAILHNLQYAAYEKWISLVSSLSIRKKLQDSLTTALYYTMIESSAGNDPTDCDDPVQCTCKIDLNHFPLERLEMIGLGGELAERALAAAALRFVNEYLVERRCFRVDWKKRETVADRLMVYAECTLSDALELALSKISHGFRGISQAQKDVLIETAISSVGVYRTASIFDYIKVWPHSEGAILDIKTWLDLKRVSDKAAVCAATDEQLQRRLLHAGASTAEVLGVYVNLINVFNKLDVRGVLLEKVSPTIRNYLRGRSDAVNVLAESLFDSGSPSEEPNTDIELCRAVGQELARATTAENGPARMTDWNDMQWLPDPIDAAPNHKSAWTYDVLTYLLSLFDHDELIKEIESVLAKHLLVSQDPEIISETSLLEHLKTRLDAAKLQNSEVMLKDVRDSVTFERRLRSTEVTVPTPKEIQAAIPPEGITITELYTLFESRMKRTQFQAALKLVATKRSDRFFPKRSRLPLEPEVKLTQEPTMPRASYRILSSSSWPQMQTAEFTMPAVMSGHLQAAEEKFSNFSGQRKLQWRPALSKASVTLELEDRTIKDHNLPAWRVAVINAFGNAPQGEGLSAQQLSQQLDMDDTLVQEALAHWLMRRVLYQKSAGVYAVLERLDMDTGTVAPSLEVETVQALKSQDAVLRENAPMFEAFITNMLSNGGPKEIGGMMGITNMMKMVLPTFTYGDDEVKWLLDQMKSKNLVQEADGDTWAAVA
ncbi:hypothetical protein AMS68_005894 [Peltaster fructicola]|uniref:Cullin family profile domain-containing protein n=1 Tax=Peltaster fructicola TaxID=286661 RepID=A0A6H0Y043_9PEZI|nr:hypothetical protein AMS68_005894 [Peltaster fructicola]